MVLWKDTPEISEATWDAREKRVIELEAAMKAQIKVDADTTQQIAIALRAAVAAEREACKAIADKVQEAMGEECDFGAGMVSELIAARGTE